MPPSSDSEPAGLKFGLRAPSRLHVTLIDMNGESGRLDGGIGLALAKPALAIDFAYPGGGCIRELARCAERLGLRSQLEGTLREEIPHHKGLGSGTQMHLSLLAAVNHAHGCGLEAAQLIRLSLRGGTSGIGTHAFFGGGFLVDGGHRRGREKLGFLPSHWCEEVSTPPLLLRHRLPADWRVVLFVPAVGGLSGVVEKEFMAANTPIPLAEVQAVSHVLLMGLLPALLEQDLETFGAAVDELQEVGWKRRHWRRPDLAPLLPVRGCFRQAGIAGCGLSSTGTTLFGFCAALEEAEERAARLASLIARHGGPPGELVVAAPDNDGMALSNGVS
jgi:beta-ribofuranosylaminobenzene 5'-phosphate synthase